MKCKFCGEELKDGANFCEFCGKEQEAFVGAAGQEEKGTADMIDALPELHDELDRIAEMREKSKHRKRRVLVSVILIVACAAGVWFGMNYLKDQRKPVQPVGGEVSSVPATSGVAGEVKETLLGSGFTQVKILDGATAEDAIHSVKDQLGITDANTSFVMKSKTAVGNDTYYRFSQTCGGLKVYGGEVVLAAAQNGTPIALNGRVVETDGLDLNAALDAGGASNAVSEYVNKLSGDYRITEGANVTVAEKVVCNFEGKTYLAYVSNVSGYNEKGEYVAYDAFVDADAGSGIYVCATSSYENGGEEAALPETDSAEVPAADSSVPPSAAESAMTMFTVNDKFNWNDKTKTSALEEIRREDIDAGNMSAYVAGTKASVDRAYAYFKDSFGYAGLNGKNGNFKVYLNSNEYLKDKLPPEKALYSGDVLMFIREDLTSGELDINVAAHEFAHGVMYHIAQFDGTRNFSENAAVAEGLADVFGELCEAHFAGGTADWIHGSRNLAAPESGFVTKLSGAAEMKDIAECYRYSTVVSHAVYQMNANGVDTGALGELCFRSLCLMTKGASFSQWRTVSELAARNMTDTGRLTEEQFAAVCAALDNTGIKGQRLYARQVDEIGGEEELEPPESETAPADDVRDKVIE